MASGTITAGFGDTEPAVSPWWHTVLVLALVAAVSVLGAVEHGMPDAHIPGLDLRLSSYLSILVLEWVLAALVWLGLRGSGLTIGALVKGSWRGPGALAKDIGLAVAFTVFAVLLTNGLMYLMGFHNDVLVRVVPKTWFELGMWMAMAVSAAFCEELVFRGYLLRQFSAWTGSAWAGVVLQGVAFGLAHGYYGGAMMVIMVHGSLLGALARWRRSLRPGMLAHGLQDGAGGVVGFFFVN